MGIARVDGRGVPVECQPGRCVKQHPVTVAQVLQPPHLGVPLLWLLGVDPAFVVASQPPDILSRLGCPGKNAPGRESKPLQDVLDLPNHSLVTRHDGVLSENSAFRATDKSKLLPCRLALNSEGAAVYGVVWHRVLSLRAASSR